ncbi:MAG: acylphosphatase [Dehalococcoidia bacterium]
MARERQIVALARGRVQGVGYRAFCAYEGMRLGVSGYAKNLPDGRVEVLAEGDESVLRQFVERLREGPALSRVDEVTFRWEVPTHAFQGFEAVI